MHRTGMPRPNRTGRPITPIRTSVGREGTRGMDLAVTAARTVVLPLTLGAAFLKGLTGKPTTDASKGA